MLALDGGRGGGPSRVADAEARSRSREVLARPGADDRRRASRVRHDPLQIIYTSGTTGDPKGVVLPNVALRRRSAMLGALLGYRPDERPYTGLSLTHGNAQAVTLGPSLAHGAARRLQPPVHQVALWDVCRAHGCTTFSMLGGMATAIYSEPPRPTTPTTRCAW